MPIVVKPTRPTAWKLSGLRMHPELRRALKSEAARLGLTMQDLHHRMLVRALQRRGYLPALTGEERWK
jgi:hypothetical protein